MTSYGKKDYILDLQAQIFGFLGKFYINNDPTMFRQTRNLIQIRSIFQMVFWYYNTSFCKFGSSDVIEDLSQTSGLFTISGTKPPRKNRLNSNACSFVKKQYFLMRLFVRFVMISSFDLANKTKG